VQWARPVSTISYALIRFVVELNADPKLAGYYGGSISGFSLLGLGGSTTALHSSSLASQTNAVRVGFPCRVLGTSLTHIPLPGLFLRSQVVFMCVFFIQRNQRCNFKLYVRFLDSRRTTARRSLYALSWYVRRGRSTRDSGDR